MMEKFSYLNISEMNYLKLVIQCKDEDEMIAVESSISDQIKNQKKSI